MRNVLVIYEVSDEDADALARTLYWDAQMNQQAAFKCTLSTVLVSDGPNWRPPKVAGK